MGCEVADITTNMIGYYIGDPDGYNLAGVYPAT
jgi:hypothetical protein